MMHQFNCKWNILTKQPESQKHIPFLCKRWTLTKIALLDQGGDVKNENSSNVLGHQFKSGHFQCKTQIRQNNWVGTPCKGHNPQPHILREVCSWTKISIFEFRLKPYHVTTHLKAYVALISKMLQHFKCWVKNNSCKEN